MKTFTRASVLVSAFVAVSFLAATSAFAAPNNWYVAPSGLDSNDCATVITPCLTIQAAITKASDGDVINVAAGTYPEHVTIGKTLTLKGANAGIAGNAGRGVESIITGDSIGAVQIIANDVVLDGFQIMSASNALGSGIHISAAQTGANIVDNVITGNQIGIYANSAGQSFISFNLFDGNNSPGASGGSAIYSEFTQNLTINNNEFKNHTTNNPVIFAATAPDVHKNLMFLNNVIHNNGCSCSAVYAIGLKDATFTGNDITADTSDIRLGGGNHTVAITMNTLHSTVGVNVVDDGYTYSPGPFGGTPFGPNTNITIHQNSLTAHSVAGVDNSTNGQTLAVDATCNWWGATDGPGPVGPGSGDKVSTGVTYAPWLTSASLDFEAGNCNGQPPPQCNANASQVIVSDTLTYDFTDSHAAVAVTPHPAWTSISGATWVYSDALDANGSSPTGTKTFTRTFTLSGAPLDSTLQIATDNMYTVSVNGHALSTGASATTLNNFSASQTWTIPAAYLLPTNTITFVVTNPANDPVSGQPFGNPNPGGLLFKITANNNECAAPPVRVHVLKYLDGVTATASSSNSYLFPMTGTTGAYTLGNNFGGAADLYGADIGPLSSPADYTTSEVTNNIDPTSKVLPINGVCTTEGTYKLLGYKTSSVSFTDAAGQPLVTTSPAFVGVTTDQYVLVLDQTCGSGSISGNKTEWGGVEGQEKLAGWTIYIDANDNGTLDPGEVSTVTDVNGKWTFTGLPAGTYIIREVLMPGWVQKTPGNNGKYTVVLKKGQKFNEQLYFVNYKLGTISGMKFEAGPNNTHLQGLGGWVIELHSAPYPWSSPGALVASTTTAPDGSYSFTDVIPGGYKVTEVMQPGWQQVVSPPRIQLRSRVNASGVDLGNKFKVPTENDVRGATAKKYNANWVSGVSRDGEKKWSIRLGDHSTDATDFAYYSFPNWWNQRLDQVMNIKASFLVGTSTTNSGGSPRLSLQVEDVVDGATTGTIFLDPAYCSDAAPGGWRDANFTGDLTNCSIYTSFRTAPYVSTGTTTAWAQLIADPLMANKRVYLIFAIQDATVGFNYIDRILLDGTLFTNKP